MEDWFAAFLHLPVGSSCGSFDGKTWRATIKRSADKKRHWLYAEEAGGNDFVSANIYVIGDDVPLLKPCEMPPEKVRAFLLGYQPE